MTPEDLLRFAAVRKLHRDLAEIELLAARQCAVAARRELDAAHEAAESAAQRTEAHRMAARDLSPVRAERLDAFRLAETAASLARERRLDVATAQSRLGGASEALDTARSRYARLVRDLDRIEAVRIEIAAAASLRAEAAAELAIEDVVTTRHARAAHGSGGRRL